MFITGYHGTSKVNAEIICHTKEFVISRGDRQWLGNGIYFYPNINDAYNWNSSEVILHTIVYVDDNEYIDIDDGIGKEIYKKTYNFMCNYAKNSLDNYDIDTSYKNATRNQCAVINTIWEAYKNIQVISASFATEKTAIPTLVNIRDRRKEFCLRNNSRIIWIEKIDRSELDDRCKKCLSCY